VSVKGWKCVHRPPRSLEVHPKGQGACAATHTHSPLTPSCSELWSGAKLMPSTGRTTRPYSIICGFCNTRYNVMCVCLTRRCEAEESRRALRAASRAQGKRSPHLLHAAVHDVHRNGKADCGGGVGVCVCVCVRVCARVWLQWWRATAQSGCCLQVQHTQRARAACSVRVGVGGSRTRTRTSRVGARGAVDRGVDADEATARVKQRAAAVACWRGRRHS
jgi:hypothetical protein